jgi:transcriptional regulator with XRE-family HTH domain
MIHDLKKWREDRGIKLKELSKIIGVSPQTIMTWQRNERHPKYIDLALYGYDCKENGTDSVDNLRMSRLSVVNK